MSVGIDSNMINSIIPDPSSEKEQEKVSASREAEKKAQRLRESEKQREKDDLLNPVDRNLVAQQANLGVNIALSILMGSISGSINV